MCMCEWWKKGVSDRKLLRKGRLMCDVMRCEVTEVKSHCWNGCVRGGKKPLAICDAMSCGLVGKRHLVCWAATRKKTFDVLHHEPWVSGGEKRLICNVMSCEFVRKWEFAMCGVISWLENSHSSVGKGVLEMCDAMSCESAQKKCLMCDVTQL
jgi:hypothetical protein